MTPPISCLHYNAVIMVAIASQTTRSKKTSKLRVTGLCAGNSPEAGEFPAQMASNAENVSIWWRHHGNTSPSSYLSVCASQKSHHQYVWPSNYDSLSWFCKHLSSIHNLRYKSFVNLFCWLLFTRLLHFHDTQRVWGHEHTFIFRIYKGTSLTASDRRHLMAWASQITGDVVA